MTANMCPENGGFIVLFFNFAGILAILQIDDLTFTLFKNIFFSSKNYVENRRSRVRLS
jgi:hypothetical protein